MENPSAKVKRGRPPKKDAARLKKERIELQAQVAALKCRCMTDRTIGEKLGLHPSTVQKYWKDYLAEIAPLPDREEQRNTVREQINALLEGVLLDAQRVRSAGDPEAAARLSLGAVRLLERRAKLDGLDEPARVEVSGDAVGLDGVLAAIAVVRGEVPEDSSG